MRKITLFIVLILSVQSILAQDSDQIFERAGCKINYRILGNGSPVLLLSGGPGFSSDYLKPIAEALSDSFRFILFDQRGTGKSVPQKYDTTFISISLTLEDIEFLRKQLGYKQWIILGHSYGGLLASIYAATYPNSVSEIILVSSTGFTTSSLDYFSDNIRFRLLPSDKELFDYWNDSIKVAQNYKRAIFEMAKASTPAYFFDRKKSLLFSQNIKPEDLNIDMGQLISQDLQDIRKYDASKSSRDFKKPVLVLQGRQDLIGESIPMILSQTYPNSKLVFIEQSGHFPWIEQPKVFFDTIRSFLNTK